jgi:hypothetical protein
MDCITTEPALWIIYHDVQWEINISILFYSVLYCHPGRIWDGPIVIVLFHHPQLQLYEYIATYTVSQQIVAQFSHNSTVLFITTALIGTIRGSSGPFCLSVTINPSRALATSIARGSPSNHELVFGGSMALLYRKVRGSLYQLCFSFIHI